MPRAVWSARSRTRRIQPCSAAPWLSGPARLDSHRELAVHLLRAFTIASRWALDPGNGGQAQAMLARAYRMDDSAADALYAVEVQPGVGAAPDRAIPNQALRKVPVLRQHSGVFGEPHDLDALIGGPLVDRSVLANALAAM
ncbi:MAG: hypothetical protein ACYDC5_08555 [Candidatus Dormibacteria bacterium]